MTEEVDPESILSDLDRCLPTITPEAVSDAIKGIDLEFNPGKDFNWLAVAVRRALAISIQGENDGPDRLKNSEIKNELARLSDMALSTWHAIFERTAESDTQLLNYAFSLNDADKSTVTDDPSKIADHVAYQQINAAYERINSALSELEWMGHFLRRAANGTEAQKPNWRMRISRDLSIERARILIPVFEAAFKQPITVNAWPSDERHKRPTAFMAFYQSMIALAFGEASTRDLSGVLKEARELHSKSPVQISEGIVPENVEGIV